MRGWAKELLVLFSGILAIFIILVLETYIGFIQNFIQSGGPPTEFWTRTVIILFLAFFGYQTPNIPRFEDAARREKLQDSMLGMFLGAANGWLVFGSIWFYLDKTNYFFDFVSGPAAGTPLGDSAIRLLNSMPPMWLDVPAIYFAVALAFTFVVIVYI
jgi:hypothetical protein